MLDTYGRKYMNPLIDKGADLFLRINFSADQVTILGFIIGVCTSILVFFDMPIIACVLLWISGFLDAVDGTMARKKGNSTAWGTLLDITFDRIVEMSIVFSLALKFPEGRIYLLLMTICILFSMTIFLTVGALAKQKGIKSFYYQAGLAERTEGFILFTLMILLPQWIIQITNVFSIVVLITALQRMFEARRMFLNK